MKTPLLAALFAAPAAHDARAAQCLHPRWPRALHPPCAALMRRCERHGKQDARVAVGLSLAMTIHLCSAFDPPQDRFTTLYNNIAWLSLGGVSVSVSTPLLGFSNVRQYVSGTTARVELSSDFFHRELLDLRSGRSALRNITIVASVLCNHFAAAPARASKTSRHLTVNVVGECVRGLRAKMLAVNLCAPAAAAVNAPLRATRMLLATGVTVAAGIAALVWLARRARPRS